MLKILFLSVLCVCLFSGCESLGDVLIGINDGLNASMSGSSSGSGSYGSSSSSSSSPSYSTSSSSYSSSSNEYKTLTFNCSVPISCDYYDFDFNKQSFSYTYYTTVTANGYTEENCKKSAESMAYSEASGDVWNELRKRSDYNSSLKANSHVGTPTASRR